MKKILLRLFNHEHLGQQEAREILIKIAANEYPPAQVAAFITVFLMRPILLEELTGFRDALLDLSVHMELNGTPAIDVCGTGGDGKNTFNISTLSAFVVAGAGYKVCKHGNYGVSSACGSSNVLEFLGYRFTADVSALQSQLDRNHICFLHAPLFHPAMKSVGPIRRELGVKTFFNMLGPLVNPAQPSHQFVGVFNPNLGRLYQYILQKSDRQAYAIVHSYDGFDEISLTGKFNIKSRRGERIMRPLDLGLNAVPADKIDGGKTVEEAAKIFVDILEGKGTAEQNAVLSANAGLAIQCFEADKSAVDCVEIARESLISGKALNCLKSALAA